ncbi:NRDE family protein [Urechidicola sp. KH5]
MCTVSFLPLSNNNFILTSNRDVPFSRKRADAPQMYIEDEVELIYPKDGDAGGTWIGSSSKDVLICLMNGGFRNHMPASSYRKSRGLVVKDLLKSDEIAHTLTSYNLDGIEPFTLVVVDYSDELTLYEFVWTGSKRHLFNIPLIPHIWSSSTLYDDATKKLRESWFQEWLSKQTNFNRSSIKEFHKTAGNGDSTTDVLMKRNGGGTVSITSVQMQDTTIDFEYEAIV